MKIALILLLFIQSTFACSSFFTKSSKASYMAKNFDWSTGYGEVLFRPRNVSKNSLVSDFSWDSKYASLTFTQFGPDLPAGGINEHGLAIEALYLSSTKHPQENNNTVNEGEWIQYHLDQYKSVQEVVDNINNLVIKKVYVPVHYIACDSETCAIIEFLNGKRVVYTNLEFNILTNNSYLYSLDNAQTAIGVDLIDSAASLKRFKVLMNTKSQTLNEAFLRLKKVYISGYTKWMIVYRTDKPQLNFATVYNKELTKLNFPSDLNCSKELVGLSLENSQKSLSELKKLKKIVNKRLNANSKIPQNIKKILKKRSFNNNCL
jgi:hypothetical protein